MSKSKFEISKEKGQHLRLINLVGSWEGKTSTWFEKDVKTTEIKLNGRFNEDVVILKVYK